MILYTTIAVIVVALASIYRPTEDRRSRQRMINKIAIAAIFIILTALAALRINVGNDYATYVGTCHEIRWDGYVVTEPGFNAVVKAIYILSGKEDYLLMFGIFGAAIVAVFLKSFMDESDSFPISVFLFMALGIYYRSFNTVRYYLVLAVTLWSLQFVVRMINRDSAGHRHIDWQSLIAFILIILAASTFHKSVLMVIPVYIICRLPWGKWMYGLVALGGAILLIFREQVMAIGLRIYPSYEGTEYLEETLSIRDNLPTIVRILLVLILCAFCYREAIADREDNKLYMKLSVVALVLYTCGYYIPFVSRLGYYLITAQLLLIPNIIVAMADTKKRQRAALIVTFMSVGYFAYFLHTAGAVGTRVLPYQSWLFTDVEFTDQTDIYTDGADNPFLGKYAALAEEQDRISALEDAAAAEAETMDSETDDASGN